MAIMAVAEIGYSIYAGEKAKDQARTAAAEERARMRTRAANNAVALEKQIAEQYEAYGLKAMNESMNFAHEAKQARTQQNLERASLADRGISAEGSSIANDIKANIDANISISMQNLEATHNSYLNHLAKQVDNAFKSNDDAVDDAVAGINAQLKSTIQGANANEVAGVIGGVTDLASSDFVQDKMDYYMKPSGTPLDAKPLDPSATKLNLPKYSFEDYVKPKSDIFSQYKVNYMTDWKSFGMGGN